MSEIKINGEFLFEFDTFQRWVNKASGWFRGYGRYDMMVCLDKNLNVCIIGEDFMAARDNDLFPVKVYRLTRTIENLIPHEQQKES